MRQTVLVFFALLLSLTAGSLVAATSGTWTGEVLDVDCYKNRKAHGPDHSDCAKACLRRGQPMGLLTDDGTLVLLAAGKDGEPYEALKAWGGEKAVVTGVLAEKDGMKVVTVTGSKKAE